MFFRSSNCMMRWYSLVELSAAQSLLLLHYTFISHEGFFILEHEDVTAEKVNRTLGKCY